MPRQCSVYIRVIVCACIDSSGGGGIGNVHAQGCTSVTESATQTRPQPFFDGTWNPQVLWQGI